MFTRSVAALMVGLALAVAPLGSAALAESDGSAVTVKVNMARILRINTPAATVIIGNPGVADVTIQDPKTLVLTGKSYGQTNLIILDNMGNPIADTLIQVVQSQNDLMTVYMGAARTSLACAPNCEQIIMLGDDTGYSAAAVASSNLVKATAQQ